jgi:hypothetical protein
MDDKSRDIPTPPQSRLGLINDVQNVKNNGAVSLVELREFLASLKGRNPQEVIGIVSTSLLVQSLSVACVAMLAIMIVFTVGPYLIYGPPQSKQPAAKPAGLAANSSPNDAAKVGAGSNSAATTEASSPGVPDAEKAAKVMGLDQSKAADPKKNPLDKPDLDKLLDGQP